MSPQAPSVMTTGTVPTSVFLFLQIFSCCLVISTHGLCGPDKYPITNYPGGDCLTCEKCQEGQGLEPKCGTPIVYGVNTIDCKPCQHGKFNDKYDSSSCHVCHQCVANEKVTKQCTPTSDTICNGTCEKGFYFSRKDGTHSCQKCSHCCLDGQDEEVAECKEQGDSESKQYCAPRPDKDCTPPYMSPSTGGKHGSDTSNENKLPQTTAVIVSVVVGTIIILTGTSVTVCWYKKKKKRRTGDYQSGRSAHHYTREGPAVEETVLQNAVQGASNQDQEIRSAPSVHESDVAEDVTIIPSNEQHEMHADTVVDADVRLPQGDNGPKNSVQHSISRDYSQTRDVSAHDTVDNAVDEALAVVGADSATRTSHIRNPFTRQRSKDSQRSGGDDADGGSYHRRNSSFSSVKENVKRKFSSKWEESLVLNEEQGTDEVPGPIKILQDLEPSSQAKREGSKVEFGFRCVAHGRDSKLIYTWFKDGVELCNTNYENTLLLKSITFRDFGWYKCRVNFEGNPVDVVESSLAELNVTPRDGAKYKSLTDVQSENFQTYENVGRLLSLKKHGLGGWREVAFKYGMKHLDIKALERDSEAGNKTLDFVATATPGLTVYEFCKTLKEHNIRRLDIVQELMNHFLAPGTAYV